MRKRVDRESGLIACRGRVPNAQLGNGGYGRVRGCGVVRKWLSARWDIVYDACGFLRPLGSATRSRRVLIVRVLDPVHDLLPPRGLLVHALLVVGHRVPHARGLLAQLDLEPVPLRLLRGGERGAEDEERVARAADVRRVAPVARRLCAALPLCRCGWRHGDGNEGVGSVCGTGV